MYTIVFQFMLLSSVLFHISYLFAKKIMYCTYWGIGDGFRTSFSLLRQNTLHTLYSNVLVSQSRRADNNTEHGMGLNLFLFLSGPLYVIVK